MIGEHRKVDDSPAQLWDTLRRIQTVTFTAHSTTATGWCGDGSGTVTIESPFPTVLLFHESGVWCPTGGRDLTFRNVYRWSRLEQSIRLEHLRFGAANPVYLFDLAPEPDGNWASVSPHLCRDDTYTARLCPEPETIALTWTISGEEKNETIAYRYSVG